MVSSKESCTADSLIDRVDAQSAQFCRCKGGRLMRNLRVIAAAAVTSAALVGALGSPAMAGTIVDCTANPSALQPAIDAAPAGSLLIVSGTCIGTFSISKNLSVQGGTMDAHLTGVTLTVSSGHVTLQGVTVMSGVGASIQNAGSLALRNSLVTSSQPSPLAAWSEAILNTGVLRMFNSSASWNRSVGLINYGSAEVRWSYLSNNYGGGVDNVGLLTIVGSRIDGNGDDGQAQAGSYVGGIHNRESGTLLLTHSSVTRNVIYGEEDSAGVTNDGTMRIHDSTISANEATNAGAAGVLNRSGSLKITFSTIVGNSSAIGYVNGVGTYPDGWKTVRTRITASLVDRCSGPLASGGYNVLERLEGVGCHFHPKPSDVVGQVQSVEPLGRAPGDAITDVLYPSGAGPAVDAIPVGATAANGVSLCPAAGTTDQIFAARPRGPACDIGAVETTVYP
jgi:hypothetical protein